jgi:hypothetical protein
MTPLVIQQFAIEAMAIEIVDLPTKNCGFSINHPFIDGFSIVNHPFGGTPIYGKPQIIRFLIFLPFWDP